VRRTVRHVAVAGRDGRAPAPVALCGCVEWQLGPRFRGDDGKACPSSPCQREPEVLHANETCRRARCGRTSGGLHARTRDRGAALPFVLAALVVGAVCAAAAASLAIEAGRGARGGAAVLQAGAAADGGLAVTLARWPARWNAALAPGDTTARTVTTPAGPARVRVLRLDAERFVLEAEARSGAGIVDGPAVRRRMLFARLRHVALAAEAAVTAGGVVEIAAGATVVAADQVPDGWTGCGPPAGGGFGAAAVAAPDAMVDPGATVVGPVRTDAAAWAGAADPQFGDATYAAHATRAHVVVDAAGPLSPLPAAGAPAAPGDVGAEPCALGAASWGEPARGAGAVAACAGALPLVHLRGSSVRLRGPARLQGTLLVDGDLVVEGLVQGAGLVVVRGAVDASAGALVLDGALIAGGPVRLGAGSRVRASSCAAARANQYAARAAPLARRAWAEVLR